MRKLFFLLIPVATLLAVDEPEDAAETQAPMTYQELEEWIAKKGFISGKGFPGKLTVTGEVRTEMKKISEVLNNVKQRGGGGAISGAPTYNYDVELNLMFNYRSDITWANVKIEFDNNAGIFNGTSSRIALERAFLGVRIYDTGTSLGSIEFGRRGLSYTFDSLVEFGANMDGILFKFSVAFGFAGDCYINAGPFLVNEQKDQYGYVGEIGFLNICNTGLYLKYSLIDWDTKSFSNPVTENEFRFLNSQWVLGYKFVPPYLGKVVTLFGAFLVNHAARPLVITNDQKANIAWYTGFYIGTVQNRGDWSLGVVYQYVEALSVPQFDNNGIGTGNASRSNFFEATSAQDAFGNTNYKGIAIDLLYAFTDSITLQNSYSQSIRAQTDIGPPFRFKQYELEIIYSF